MRNLKKRTRNGLDAARQDGRVGGRRPKLTAQQQREIVALVTSGQKTGADGARLFRVHPSTAEQRPLALYRQNGAKLAYVRFYRILQRPLFIRVMSERWTNTTYSKSEKEEGAGLIFWGIS
jgi:hypothetical protein